MQEAGNGTHCAYEGMVWIGLDGTQIFWGAQGGLLPAELRDRASTYRAQKWRRAARDQLILKRASENRPSGDRSGITVVLDACLRLPPRP